MFPIRKAKQQGFWFARKVKRYSNALVGAQRMKFSVLMSLYDKEQPEFLRQCLLSLVKQTLPADEIVLVFDGKN